MSKNPANRRPKQRPSGHCPQTPAPLWASQNFLTSSRTIRRLLACTDISPQDLVVEIGPGKGHITRELLPRCGSVLAAELDSALCARLRERFAGEARLRLWQGDFLTMPLPKGPYKVFANIPFSHTTDILRRLSQAPNPPACAWLVVERGAAMRFAGQGRPGLSALMLAPFFQVRIAASIPREQFHPAPPGGRCPAGTAPQASAGFAPQPAPVLPPVFGAGPEPGRPIPAEQKAAGLCPGPGGPAPAC